MTPFSSLFSLSHVGNGRVWNWILYTLRWLYKGIIQDGYCTIRNVMKLAQRWQVYRGRSLLIYGDLLQYNIGVCQPWRRTETSLVKLSSLGRPSRTLCLFRSPVVYFCFSSLAWLPLLVKTLETFGSLFPETNAGLCLKPHMHVCVCLCVCACPCMNVSESPLLRLHKCCVHYACMTTSLSYTCMWH